MTTAFANMSPKTAALLAEITSAVEVFAPFYDLSHDEYETVEYHISQAIRCIRTGAGYDLTTNTPGMMEFRELLAEFYPAEHAIWSSLWTPEQDREWIAEHASDWE